MNRKWGNIAEDPEDPIFENWKVPDISNPEKLEKHFPVFVTHVKDEEYKVTWHLQHVEEWKRTRPETWDEFQDYEDYVEKRLKYALAVYSDNYKILPTKKPDELARFIVKKWTKRNSAKSAKSANTVKNVKKATSPKNTTKKNSQTNVPKFFLLNDIKEYFPVVWHKDPRNPKMLGIQLHKMKVQAGAKEAGIPLKEYEAKLVKKLIHALEASETSGSWKVLESRSRDYVCMLHLTK
jgi:hypothetical protein